MTVLALAHSEQSALGWKHSMPIATDARSNSKRSALVDRPLPEPRWRKITEARLDTLLEYRTGWDGYSGTPPKIGVLRFVQSLLESTMSYSTPAPSIVPMSGGGVQLEWHTNGLDIELTVYAPFQAELSVEFSNGDDPIEEQPITSDFSALGELVAELG